MKETEKCIETMFDKGLAKEVENDNGPGTDNMSCILLEFIK